MLLAPPDLEDMATEGRAAPERSVFHAAAAQLECRNKRFPRRKVDMATPNPSANTRPPLVGERDSCAPTTVHHAGAD